MYRWLPVLLILIALPLSAQEWEEETEESQNLRPSADTDDDLFGLAVGISGDTMIVGAPDDSVAKGAAYIFRYNRDDEEWAEEQKLTTADGEELELTGYSVSVCGEVAVLGAPSDDDNGSWSGSAYFFRHDPDEDEWIEEQKVTASNGSEDDWFGFSVCVSGDVAIVGAPYVDVSTVHPNAGTAYVYRYNSDTLEWVQEERLRSSDTAGHSLGYSVSIDGDVAVAGVAGGDPGTAYVFRFDADEEEWVEEQALSSSDGIGYAHSVAVSGDLVVIGVIGEDDFGEYSGAAYAHRYDPTEGSWTEEQRLTASDGAEGDYFGYSVAASGRMLLVGSERAFSESGIQSGTAYLYYFDDSAEEWLEERKLAASDGLGADYFGITVALSDEFAVVGELNLGGASGSAYVFHAPRHFLRGDVDGNGVTTALVDAFRLLEWSFIDGAEPPCMDAADVDDDGTVSALVDALGLLLYSFANGDRPPEPGPDGCGADSTEDELLCTTAPEDCR